MGEQKNLKRRDVDRIWFSEFFFLIFGLKILILKLALDASRGIHDKVVGILIYTESALYYPFSIFL